MFCSPIAIHLVGCHRCFCWHYCRVFFYIFFCFSLLLFTHSLSIFEYILRSFMSLMLHNCFNVATAGCYCVYYFAERAHHCYLILYFIYCVCFSWPMQQLKYVAHKFIVSFRQFFFFFFFGFYYFIF